MTSGPSRFTLRAYRAAERVPVVGRTLFSGAFRLASPYFLTIPASLESVEPGTSVASMRQFPWVRNHLGGVHAIALCNLAEFAMGAVAEATIPATHRWIPKSMSVDYKAKAGGKMTATATLPPPELPGPGDAGIEVPVGVAITNPDGREVFAAEITLWVTAGPRD